MTFPTVPSLNTTCLVAAQANTTAARTFPSLSSLTKNNGDLLIAIVVAYNSAAGTANWASWGGGFTEFYDSGFTGVMAVGMAYKWSTGSETGTFTVTQQGTITGHAVMFLLAIPGAHASTIPEVTAIATGTSAAADPAALTPSWGADDTLWIAVGGGGEVATTGSFTGLGTAPTNYTGSIISIITQDAVGGLNAGVAFRQLNAASEDSGPWSVDTSNARNAALLLAVRPAATIPAGGGAGTFAFTGASDGSAVMSGSGAGLFAFTGASDGSTSMSGSGAGLFAFTGAADGSQPPNTGGGAGAFAFTGASGGSSPNGGTSAGLWAFTGASDGTAATAGTGAGLWTFTGAADGSAPVVGGMQGGGAGTFAFTGAAAGSMQASGGSAGTYAFTGAASGSAPGGGPPEAAVLFKVAKQRRQFTTLSQPTIFTVKEQTHTYRA